MVASSDPSKIPASSAHVSNSKTQFLRNSTPIQGSSATIHSGTVNRSSPGRCCVKCGIASSTSHECSATTDMPLNNREDGATGGSTIQSRTGSRRVSMGGGALPPGVPPLPLSGARGCIDNQLTTSSGRRASTSEVGAQLPNPMLQGGRDSQMYQRNSQGVATAWLEAAEAARMLLVNMRGPQDGSHNNGSTTDETAYSRMHLRPRAGQSWQHQADGDESTPCSEGSRALASENNGNVVKVQRDSQQRIRHLEQQRDRAEQQRLELQHKLEAMQQKLFGQGGLETQSVEESSLRDRIGELMKQNELLEDKVKQLELRVSQSTQRREKEAVQNVDSLRTENDELRRRSDDLVQKLRHVELHKNTEADDLRKQVAEKDVQIARQLGQITEQQRHLSEQQKLIQSQSRRYDEMERRYMQRIAAAEASSNRATTTRAKKIGDQRSGGFVSVLLNLQREVAQLRDKHHEALASIAASGGNEGDDPSVAVAAAGQAADSAFNDIGTLLERIKQQQRLQPPSPSAQSSRSSSTTALGLHNASGLTCGSRSRRGSVVSNSSSMSSVWTAVQRMQEIYSKTAAVEAAARNHASGTRSLHRSSFTALSSRLSDAAQSFALSSCNTPASPSHMSVASVAFNPPSTGVLDFRSFAAAGENVNPKSSLPYVFSTKEPPSSQPTSRPKACVQNGKEQTPDEQHKATEKCTNDQLTGGNTVGETFNSVAPLPNVVASVEGIDSSLAATTWCPSDVPSENQINHVPTSTNNIHSQGSWEVVSSAPGVALSHKPSRSLSQTCLPAVAAHNSGNSRAATSFGNSVSLSSTFTTPEHPNQHQRSSAFTQGTPASPLLRQSSNRENFANTPPARNLWGDDTGSPPDVQFHSTKTPEISQVSGRNAHRTEHVLSSSNHLATDLPCSYQERKTVSTYSASEFFDQLSSNARDSVQGEHQSGRRTHGTSRTVDDLFA